MVPGLDFEYNALFELVVSREDPLDAGLIR